MLAPADVRRTETGVRHKLVFIRDVVLLEPRILEIERYGVRGDALKADRTTGKRSNAAWVDSPWQS